MNWDVIARAYEYHKGHTPTPMQMGKIAEEYGEAWEAYVNMTGGNPRKDATAFCAGDVADELADIIVTAAVTMFHFVGDPEEVLQLCIEKIESRIPKGITDGY